MELYNSQIWQRNYYERVIRNQTELERIGTYIIANPGNWAEDEENQFVA
jgi:putative transposase